MLFIKTDKSAAPADGYREWSTCLPSLSTLTEPFECNANLHRAGFYDDDDEGDDGEETGEDAGDEIVERPV